MFGEGGHNMVIGLGVVEISCVWWCDNSRENVPTGWIFGEDGLWTMASRFDFLLGKTGWFSESNGDLLTGRQMG